MPDKDDHFRKPNGHPPRGEVASWARITELAREVLRERGLSDPEIEAELTKLEPPKHSPPPA